MFAKVAAGVFAANGVKVNIWPVLMPVPTVSFATRYLHTSAGVMVTASHNPSKYNGYKRLWPLSNDVRSKQFIKLFKNNDEYESMVQRVYRQITTVDADAKITIATSKSQASAIKNQLGEKASICVEPCRRDTFPAIALAAA